MKQQIKISSIIIGMLLAAQINAQVSQLNNGPASPGNYLGWNGGTTIPLEIRHNANQPINIFTNNLMRATFTTGGAFGTGSTQGDGLRIFDPSGGPGHLELWTSSSTQTHIRWNGSGTIQGMNGRFEMIGNLNGFWYNTTTPSGRYLFNRQDAEVGRIGSNNFWQPMPFAFTVTPETKPVLI